LFVGTHDSITPSPIYFYTKFTPSTMRHVIFLLVLLMLGAGCASNYYYQPAQKQNDQVETFFNHGLPALHQRVGDVGVTAELHAHPRYFSLGLFIKNVGDADFEFDPGTIKVWGYNAKGEGHRLTTYSADQFVKRERRRNLIIAGVATAVLIGTAVAVAESNSTSNSSAKDVTNNNNDNWCFDSGIWWWGDFSTPTPSPGTAGSLLRKHTLFKDEGLQGVVKIGQQSGFTDKIIVEIPVHGERIRFVYDGRTKKR
jgi:hypothetical protein